MNKRQGEMYQMYRAAQACLDRHDNLLGPINQTGLRKQFDALVDKMGACATVQEARTIGSRGGTLGLGAAKRILREHHMEPIAALAAVLALEHVQLGAIQEPKPRASTIDLITGANAMADLVEGYALAFIREGLDPDFIWQLRAASKAVMDATLHRSAQKGAHVGATVGIVEIAKRARLCLIALAKLVRKYSREHPTLTQEWTSARHLPAHTRRALGSGAAAGGSADRALASGNAPKALPAGPPVTAVDELGLESAEETGGANSQDTDAQSPDVGTADIQDTGVEEVVAEGAAEELMSEV